MSSSGRGRWVTRLIGVLLVIGLLVLLKVVEGQLKDLSEARQADREKQEAPAAPLKPLPRSRVKRTVPPPLPAQASPSPGSENAEPPGDPVGETKKPTSGDGQP